ncbi:MAG: cardiolipin synthase [Clostridium perfringens]|nr:cardiolipin synthase [Clostridium perfringens]
MRLYISFRIMIYLIDLLIALNLVFKERRDVRSTLSWIVLFIFIPIISLIIYIFIGRNINNVNMFNLKNDEDLYLKEKINKSLENMNKIDENTLEVLHKNKRIIDTFLNLGDGVLTKENKVHIYTKPDEMFESLLYELKNAKRFINMQYYIFRNDDMGKKVLEILSEKAKEGVEIRFLYDAVGSKKFKKKYLKEFKRNGGKVAVFFPSFLRVINFNINYRNHRKVVIIDGKLAFLGGSNIGNEYLGKDKKLGNWRDTDIMIQGTSVNYLDLRFLLDWRYASREDIDFSKYLLDGVENNDKNEGTYIQIVSSGPDLNTPNIEYGYLNIIELAKEYVYIQSPYLILDKATLECIRLSSLKGVDVRIMIPSKPDHPFIHWATYSYIGELLEYGVKIYLYDENSFMHAKTIVADDIVLTVGTANMDIRSFKLNFEMNAFIYSIDSAKRQREIFYEDIKNSVELTKEIYENRGGFIKLKENISRLLSPIL